MDALVHTCIARVGCWTCTAAPLFHQKHMEPPHRAAAPPLRWRRPVARSQPVSPLGPFPFLPPKEEPASTQFLFIFLACGSAFTPRLGGHGASKGRKAKSRQLLASSQMHPSSSCIPAINPPSHHLPTADCATQRACAIRPEAACLLAAGAGAGAAAPYGMLASWPAGTFTRSAHPAAPAAPRSWAAGARSAASRR